MQESTGGRKAKQATEQRQARLQSASRGTRCEWKSRSAAGAAAGGGGQVDDIFLGSTRPVASLLSFLSNVPAVSEDRALNVKPV